MRTRAFIMIPAVVLIAVAMLIATPAAAASPHAEAAVALPDDETRTIPETVWYQGFLADVDTGDPINGTFTVVAQMYDAESGGSSLWGPETHNGVSFVEGWFNIELGETQALPAFDSPPYYLQLTVNGELFAPRLKLASAPTALRSSIAEQGDGDWAVNGINLYRLTGNVGIGDSTPDYRLDVEGSVGATTYYGDGSNLTGIAGTNDNDWSIDGDDVYHLVGRVGIGTTSPENSFHVAAAGSEAGGVPGWSEIVGRFHRNGNSHTGLSIDATTLRDPILYFAENDRARWSIRSDASEDRNLEIRFHEPSGTVYAATVDTLGRVGIGTRDPGAWLAVEGDDANEALEVIGTYASGVGRLVNIERTQASPNANDMLQIKMASGSDDGAEFIEFERGSTVEARIKANGNILTTGSVRIGDSANAPDARLHITEDLYATDPILVEIEGETAFNVSDTGVGVNCLGGGTGLEVHNTDGYSNPAMAVRHYGSYAVIAGIYAQSSPGSGDALLYVHTNSSPVSDFQYVECHTGFMPGDVEFKVNGGGYVYADGGYYSGADFSEMLAVSSGGRSVEAGDVMVIDPSRDRSIVMATKAYSTLAAGVYSTSPGFVGSPRDWDKTLGEDQTGTYSMDEMATMHNEIPLAVMGIVPCKVSAENGPINPGDLLVTSDTPGHAMREADPPNGTIIGKALGSLGAGTGVIEVLVTLQ